MIQHHRISGHTPPWNSVLLLCVILTGQPVNAADPGYPPPPGAYRSEPAARTESTLPSAPAIRPGTADGGPNSTQGSSRLLPLPDEMFGTRPGKYNANTLFGSSAPFVRGPSETLEQADGQPAASTGPDRFAPLPRPSETPPGYNTYPVDVSRGSQPPPAAPTQRAHGGPAQAAYPSYPPGYPAYQQQYQSPYHPGATTGYAPAISSPGYVDRYAPGYPQTGGNMPPRSHYPAAAPDAAGYVPDSYHAPDYVYAYEDRPDGVATPGTLPGAPLSAPPPNPGDASVFRPPE